MQTPIIDTADMTTSPATPSWRQLTTLAVLVAGAHVLVLQAAPAQLGTTLNTDTASVRPLVTRSIEAPPVAQVATAAQASPSSTSSLASPAQAAPVRRTRPQKSTSNPAPAQEEYASLATNSVANNEASNVLPSQPDSAARTADMAEITALKSPSATPPAAAPVPAVAALPPGPKTTPVTAISLPPSVLLQYKVIGASKGLNYYANAELVWHNTGNQYDATMKVSALFVGSRSLTSAGRITSSGLAPTRFADKFRTELAAHFETDKGKITFSANSPDALWVEGTQDRVSVFVQLGGMIAARPADFPPGSSITLYTVGPRDADTWTFLIGNEEKLQLPAGEMTALKLTRKPRAEHDQTIEIWYAPALGYLPVRNRVTQQSGDFIDQQLTQAVKP